MKVATWNVNQAGDERAEIAGRTLREHEVDIALLQEVSPSSFATLQREAGFDWGISLARNFGPMLDVVGRGGTRCVAIAGKNFATTITIKDGPMRYDQIWATAEFEVRDVVHDTSVLKTQFNPDGRFDHALVVADLVLT